nr:PD40 domain-containing protein [Lysinibacillus timonensis]
MDKLKLLKIATPLFVLLTLAACSMGQEEDRTVIQDPGESINDTEDKITETNVPSISIEKVDKFEGMEITDWFDEQTVVLAKENEEFGKMSLLENSEYYPRSIYLYNLDTKEYKTVKAQKDMFLGGATLSPDKKHLLYYEYSFGDVAHYLMSMDNMGQPVAEDNLGIAYTAEWADNQHVIGASYAGGAYMADTDRNITQIAELEEEQLFTVQKIQDKIYYITTNTPTFQLHMLDLVTKEKRDLNVENVDGITFSPDGKQILISQGTESTRRLLLADAEGNILKTIAEGSEITGDSWSPNQQRIAYQLKSVINGEDSSGLYVYDVLTGESTQLAADVRNAHIIWSPSGDKIAVTELDGLTYNSSVIYLR